MLLEEEWLKCQKRLENETTPKARLLLHFPRKALKKKVASHAVLLEERSQFLTFKLSCKVSP